MARSYAIANFNITADKEHGYTQNLQKNNFKTKIKRKPNIMQQTRLDPCIYTVIQGIEPWMIIL